ncbi:MurR/RpiR family transcriptional regulator [Oceanobacillus neutriphilus]|uniref:Transcriptional regulator n=1 Tax=Oceanobacillus neutriphilus TaxID=531815 RepID=A0ABQ2NUW7_9BACI|nr:MurR/RpiR family transcriptional regulator [Oceanobacillus neutriphilus]GGP11085.1 transcriptional regulator [Oceanobacillus neutriphilus]
MIIQLDKEIYERLSEAEALVIDYINQNEDKIPVMSITSIAEKSFTSSATVSRTIQKCGFSGISELKFKISEQKQKKGENNSPYEVNKILAKSFRECTQTIDNISTTAILDTIKFIENANRVYIFSRGFTALVAEEFQMYLQLVGFNTVIVKDVMWMLNAGKIVKEGDLAIFITIQSTTPELARAAKAIKTNNAKMVTICCKPGTKLEELSDITILGHTENIMKIKGLDVYSRIPLNIITRTIIEYISK